MIYKYLILLLFNWYTVLAISVNFLRMTELLIDLNLLPEFINMIFFTILILGVSNITLNLQDFVLTGYNIISCTIYCLNFIILFTFLSLCGDQKYAFLLSVGFVFLLRALIQCHFGNTSHWCPIFLMMIESLIPETKVFFWH